MYSTSEQQARTTKAQPRPQYSYSIVDESERANLIGDVPALFLVAAVLWYLTPRRAEI